MGKVCTVTAVFVLIFQCIVFADVKDPAMKALEVNK